MSRHCAAVVDGNTVFVAGGGKAEKKAYMLHKNNQLGRGYVYANGLN